MKTKIVRKVLMCRPKYFSVDYSINPWMVKGSADGQKALSQWNQLVKVYKRLSIEVEIIDQVKGVPDMVFATDQGIFYNNSIVVSNFKYPERQKERDFYKKWFEDKNFTFFFLPEDITFEGSGESLFINNKIFIGVGFRTNIRACKFIEKFLGIEVVPISLKDPRFFHLDTALFPLNDRIAFYYPRAFTKKSLEALKANIPLLIPFEDFEVENFAANSITTDHHVVMQSGIPTFKDKVESLGYRSIEVDLREFMKAGGGAHCLTAILEEEVV